MVEEAPARLGNTSQPRCIAYGRGTLISIITELTISFLDADE